MEPAKISAVQQNRMGLGLDFLDSCVNCACVCLSKVPLRATGNTGWNLFGPGTKSRRNPEVFLCFGSIFLIFYVELQF